MECSPNSLPPPPQGLHGGHGKSIRGRVQFSAFFLSKREPGVRLGHVCGPDTAANIKCQLWKCFRSWGGTICALCKVAIITRNTTAQVSCSDHRAGPCTAPLVPPGATEVASWLADARWHAARRGRLPRGRRAPRRSRNATSKTYEGRCSDGHGPFTFLRHWKRTTSARTETVGRVKTSRLSASAS